MGKQDVPAGVDGGVQGGVDDPSSFQRHRDGVHCCPSPVQVARTRRGLLGRFLVRVAVNVDSAGQGWWWCLHHRPHRLRRRCCSRDEAQNDADCSRERDDAGRLQSGPDGGGSYQRLERSPA